MPKIGQVRTNLPVLSPWQQHVESWKGCTRCNLCQTRTIVVLARGSIPADVLFIGEAPGHHEDAHGQPFVGPAVQLLDKIINRAIFDPAYNGELIASCCFSNLVCCLPVDPDNPHQKVDQPEHESLLACQPRLVELINMVRPKLLVRVGKLAKEYIEGGDYRGWKHSIKLPPRVAMLDILHPAFILRTNIANREIFTQRTVVQISHAVEEAISRPGWGEDDRAYCGPSPAKPLAIPPIALPPKASRPVWDNEDVPF